MAKKHICYYSAKPDCSEEDLCRYCAQNKAMDELAEETEKLFTPEQRELIDNWLDKNQKLMDDLDDEC